MTSNNDGQKLHEPAKDIGASVQCELVLCIDCGPATMLKWCPLPSNDPVRSSLKKTRKMEGMIPILSISGHRKSMDAQES